jgi:hypothetical protein
VYKNKNADDTVDSFTNIILLAMDLSIPWNTVSKPKFPNWFSPILKHYIRKKIIFIGAIGNINRNTITVNVLTIGNLLKLQLNMTDLIGTKVLMMI